MFEFRLGVDDLAATWFGYSPLQETVLSLRTRRRPGCYPEQQRWVAGWRSRYAALDTALLDSLVTPLGFVPDFLTPRPAVPRPEFDAELAGLAATPPEVVRTDVLTAYRSAGNALPPVLAELVDDPSALTARVAGALEAYWTQCLAPAWWPRARSVLEADIAYRGRRLSEHGAEGLFADLDGRLSWQAGVLRLVDPHPATTALGTTVDVAGRGLVLMPTLFALGAVTDITQGGPPLITYPARGKATMGEDAGTGRRPPEQGSALAGLIGPPRARLLILLETPASTTELAHRLGVTPAAVSHHLGALTAAGLLERARHGRSVLYRRSGLGDDLATGGRRMTANS
ncbi:helix-turn-helix domain-containing protein [Kitasatospora sp. NPDC048298]|uniref:ArsR/SmtB family transcription factor n=1 Tax=Kitasatospora sp. NPDC048298 TaxID=3364049 RepID=UPI003718F743